MIPVRDVKLNNTEFLKIIDEYKDTLFGIAENGKRNIENEMPLKGQDLKAEDWVGDEYMHKIINEGKAHDGFPKQFRGFDSLKHVDEGVQVLPGNKNIVRNASAKVNQELLQYISARNNSLNAAYNPGGFISWHNNANAHGYNLILTYSETGEGWFDYWDIDEQKRCRINDVPGWQCKMTYFGPYEEPNKVCYHAAYTDCYRITIAYVFAQANAFWEEVIEDLETPL